MNYYRCENPDCGFLAEEEPDVCPQCGGTFFLSVDEEELTGPTGCSWATGPWMRSGRRTRWPATNRRRPWMICWV